MSMITERISAIGIMPVIAKLESEADCAALADALTRGGSPQMEITFRMEGAENYIRYARSYAPDTPPPSLWIISTAMASVSREAVPLPMARWRTLSLWMSWESFMIASCFCFSPNVG